jgi:hypothetical protein
VVKVDPALIDLVLIDLVSRDAMSIDVGMIGLVPVDRALLPGPV